MEARNDVPVISPRPRPTALPIFLALLWTCCLGIGIALADADPNFPAPEDWQTVPLCGCKDATEFTAGRTPARPLFDFSAYDLDTTDKARVTGKSLRWHFCSKGTEQTWARLAYCRSLPEPFDAISLHVKNPNGHALSLHIEALDAGGLWHSGPVQALGDERNWRQLTFHLGDFAPEAGQTDPRPGVDFPIIWTNWRATERQRRRSKFATCTRPRPWRRARQYPSVRPWSSSARPPRVTTSRPFCWRAQDPWARHIWSLRAAWGRLRQVFLIQLPRAVSRSPGGCRRGGTTCNSSPPP